MDDALVRKALESGVDLRQYSSELQEQLRSAHSLAVKDCIEQAEKLAELHTEIMACDDAFAVSYHSILPPFRTPYLLLFLLSRLNDLNRNWRIIL